MRGDALEIVRDKQRAEQGRLAAVWLAGAGAQFLKSVLARTSELIFMIMLGSANH